MNILYIAFTTIKRNFRDKATLANTLLLPILLILILGNALNGAYQPTKINKTKVAIVNLDVGSGGRQLDSYLRADEIAEMIEVVALKTNDEAVKMINDRKVEAMIFVGEDFSNRVGQARTAELKVTGYRSDTFSMKIIQNIVDSYVNGANTYQAALRLNKQLEFENKEFVEKLPVASTTHIPRAIDYYAVTMLVMMMIYSSLYGVHGIGEDYLEKTGTRLKSLPINIYKQLAGSTLGLIATSFVQSLFIMLFSKLAFGAFWGNNYLMILAIIFSTLVFATSLGEMLCMLTGNRMTATGILNVIIPIFTFFSGGYTKIADSDPVAVFVTSYLTPNGLAHTSIFNTIYGGPISETLLCVGILWIMALICFVITAVSGRRRFN